jgi:hypothetical protein
MQMPRRRFSARWRVPAVAVAGGLAMLAAQWSAGYLGRGLVSLGIMLAFAASLVAFSGRSGLFEVMRDPGTDERTATLDLRATAFAGVVVVVVLVGAFVYETARGRNGEPYSWLCAVAGLSYLLALAGLHRRS